MDERSPARLLSLDAFRGTILVFLIPDVFGGFSFHEMARRFPSSAAWSWLARQFTHAEWAGATIWDLVMPSFIYMIGMSMPFSHASRVQLGHSRGSIVTHAALRGAALLMLGMLVLLPSTSGLATAWPFFVLSLGLPVPALLARRFDREGKRHPDFFERLWWGFVLGATAIRLARELHSAPAFSLHDILAQVGLAYLPAFLLVGRGRRMQICTVAAILVGYWTAFRFYPVSIASQLPSFTGALTVADGFSGDFAHWNKHANLAARFDVWFLNLFPRPYPFTLNSHGYQTLSFVPVIASMIMGVMVGEYVRSDRNRAMVRDTLIALGALMLGAGLLSGWLVSPIVKSIWTPSWVLFSTGAVILLYSVVYHFTDIRAHVRWTEPLVVVGRNSLLLYVLALHYRWWVLLPWRHTVGRILGPVDVAPVLEALACLAVLWVLAWVLYRARLFIRI